MKNWKTLKKETALDCGKFLKVEYHCVQFDDGTTNSVFRYAEDPGLVTMEGLDYELVEFSQ